MPADWENILRFHGFLVSDVGRLEQFRRAILAQVKPGDVVLDLGCGTGILGHFAIQAGARRVYAIEPDEVIELARLIADRNGVADRFVFIHDRSENVVLPEPVDVIVTDLLGAFGINVGIAGILADARTRFLKPGGRLIPRSVDLFLCPADLPELRESVDEWSNGPLGVDVTCARTFVSNNPHHVRVPASSLLADACPVASIDLRTATGSTFQSEAHFKALREATVTAFAGWFRGTLGDNEFVTNSPIAPNVKYRHLVFPIGAPFRIQAGAPIRVSLHSTGNGSVWVWRGESPGVRFEHSTAFGFPLSKERFRKASSESRPSLTPKGEALWKVLALCRDQRSVGEIEAEVWKQFCNAFRSKQDVSDFVRDVVNRWA